MVHRNTIFHPHSLTFRAIQVCRLPWKFGYHPAIWMECISLGPDFPVSLRRIWRSSPFLRQSGLPHRGLDPLHDSPPRTEAATHFGLGEAGPQYASDDHAGWWKHDSSEAEERPSRNEVYVWLLPRVTTIMNNERPCLELWVRPRRIDGVCYRSQYIKVNTLFHDKSSKCMALPRIRPSTIPVTP